MNPKEHLKKNLIKLYIPNSYSDLLLFDMRHFNTKDKKIYGKLQKKLNNTYESYLSAVTFFNLWISNLKIIY